MHRPTRFPEILAPAGDLDCLRAACGAGADAVYFGLSTGFNARAKAENFTLEGLAETFAYLHARGVKGYVAFNTVVYDSELAKAAECLAGIARAGADAIIVQDLGVARLAHAIAPGLAIHASTQMTVSSPEAALVAKSLGVVRVVLPRELSVAEIAKFKARTELELECFVHGALCVSYSGQCLTSEAWGKRSANRGQCAQSCRLPYDLMLDGAAVETGLEKYLLSPKDLGAWELLPALIDAGVSCFKIEGRYKGPDYVAATVEKYRKVRDAYVMRGERLTLEESDIEDMALTYGRAFSHGWLSGDDHQELSHGLHPGHRGLRVGEVVRAQGWSVFVRKDAGAPEVRTGSWMLVDKGTPQTDEPQGGVYAVAEGTDGLLEVRFGEGGPDVSQIRPGHVLWKAHDAAVKRRLLRFMDEARRIALDLVVRGALGRPLEVAALDVHGRAAVVSSEAVLEAAKGAPLGEAVLRDKLGSLGGTAWELRILDVSLEGDLALSPAELKRTRRRLVEKLEAIPLPTKAHDVHPVDLKTLASASTPTLPSASMITAHPERSSTAGRAESKGHAAPLTPALASPTLIPLCRTADQVDAALSLGAREVILDFMEVTGLGQAARRVRAAGARVVIATPRIQKPGEEPLDRRFEALAPDGILARHLGALERYQERLRGGAASNATAAPGSTSEDRPAFTLHGDFSLNCTNAITGRLLLGMGLATMTPSYDLNIDQVEALARGLPAERLEVTAHQHLPLYHTEYCLYAHHLSDGKDYTDCGRPCEAHRVSLRDAKRLEHPVLVDVGCRNTVFHAQAQTAAPYVERLLGLGVRRFRVELVWETGAEAKRVLGLYGALLRGEASAKDVVRQVGGLERYGVTGGTLVTVA